MSKATQKNTLGLLSWPVEEVEPKSQGVRQFVEKVGKGHREGLLNDFNVEIEKRQYKLVFMDFYRLVEEWMRARDFYKLEWFAKGELVIVKSINLETIDEALKTLTERHFFNLIAPEDAKKEKNGAEANSCKHKIIFPEWYREDIEVQQECQEKGSLDGAIVEFDLLRRYEVHFEDFVSFSQRFAENARRGEVYLAEPGLILVSTITIELIEKAVNWLVEQGYFERIKPKIKRTGDEMIAEVTRAV